MIWNPDTVGPGWQGPLQIITENHQLVNGKGPPQAQLLPAAAGGDHGLGKRDHATIAPHLPDQGEILHNALVGKTPQAPEKPGWQKQTLVSIRQLQPTGPQVGHGAHDLQTWQVAGDLKAEGSGAGTSGTPRPGG